MIFQGTLIFGNLVKNKEQIILSVFYKRGKIEKGAISQRRTYNRSHSLFITIVMYTIVKGINKFQQIIQMNSEFWHLLFLDVMQLLFPFQWKIILEVQNLILTLLKVCGF